MYKIDDNELRIIMYEGDYGEKLPISIIDSRIELSDIISFIIEDSRHQKIIEKQLTRDDDGNFIFSITAEESKMLTEGNYLWGLKLIRADELVDTLTANQEFVVIKGQ